MQETERRIFFIFLFWNVLRSQRWHDKVKNNFSIQFCHLAMVFPFHVFFVHFFFIWFVRFGEGSNILAPFILLASPLPYNYHFYLVIRLKNVIICLKVRFSNSIQTVTATYFIQHISQCCWCTVSLRICIKKWLSEKLLLSPA